MLPKKPTQQDIHEIKRQTRIESTKKEKSKKEESPKMTPRKEKSVTVQTTEAIIEAPKRFQRSYMTIEDFMRDIDGNSKLDMTSTKVTSTPSKNVSNVLQDTYNTLANDSEGQLSKHDAMWSLASPKNSKSVLKSTSNVSGSVKKKVLFDLEKDTKIVTELFDDFSGQKEQDSDWNTSR